MSQYACAEATAAAKVKKCFIEDSERGSKLKKSQKGPVKEGLGWKKDSCYKGKD
jgi:hypothetical protein